MPNTNVGVTLTASMDVSQVLGAVKQIEGSLKGLKLPDDIGGNLKKNLSNVTDLLKKYQSQLEKPINTKTDAKAISKTATEIEKVFGAIDKDINELSNRQIYLKADLGPLNELKSRLFEIRAEYQKSIQDIGKGSGVYDAIGALEKAASRSSLTLGSLGVAKNAFNKGDLEGYANAIDDVYNRLTKLSEGTIGKAAKGLGIDVIGSDGQLKTKAVLLDEIRNKLTALQKVDLKGTSAENLLKDVEQLSKELANTDATGLKNAEQAVSQIGETANNAASGFQAMSQEADKFVQSTLSAAQQVQQLQQSTQYFFSLRNMINLLKRGVQDAIETVKELDAAMTETAVVTDFSVGDMWEKLPEYTANANALGASVKDMYEATTLYYQQGLNTEQSMAIASETMKMARIGGLEAADATDKMTAALRGFNMELNEASAQRVNDVYSNLAAKTASDTEELGTAMQRTASIAASAGMSFEGTAAFLAQAIETTREPAENLGTAMKTIVARFTELKKNPLEISEVDGEEVDYNKVDTALQSIGVSLKDANGQFRALDQVFLDIAQRWDSLSQTQQRYVATTAAGSRQQSRFIAMMSNYERTVELMDYANNSAGASNEQFGKTMESLEAKLNQLRNAWDRFEMGIANNSIIKGAVDGLTGILDITNNLIDTFSLGIGPLKSFLSLFAAFTGLKAGGRLVNSLIGGLGGLVDPTSSFGKGFWGANTKEGIQNAGIAGKISTPIVAKLNELIAVTKGTKAEKTQTTSTIGQYKNASAMLRNGALSIGDVNTVFKDLSDEHAYAAYRGAPGTIDAMQQATLGWLNSKQLSTEAQKTGQQLTKAIFKGMSKKEIPIKDGIKLLGQPQKWGQYFGTNVAQEFSNNFSRQLTTDANKIALEKLGLDASKYQVGSSELKNLLSDATYRMQYKRNFLEARAQLEEDGLNNVQINPTQYQQLANQVGIVGSKFTAAGMSIQMFGAQLSQLSPALQGVGTLLMQVGSAVSTLGMGASGLGKVFTGVGKRVAAGMAAAQAAKYGSTYMAEAVASGAIQASTLTTAGGATVAKGFISGFTGGMSAGPIAAIIAAVVTGGIMIAKSIADKKAKEAGEEVRKNFEEGFTKNEEKIQSIEDIRGRFEELSKGVDRFGHNVNLSNEDYNEYLSLSRELSQLSPSLIAGYNAEGEAILKTGAALDEVVGKLKEAKQEALENYIDDKSVNKLVKEFKTSDAYKDNRARLNTRGDGRDQKAFQSEMNALKRANTKANLDFNVADAIQQLGGGEVSSLDSLSTSQLNFVAQHYNDILNLVKEKNTELSSETEEGLKSALGGIGGAIEDVMTEGKPVVDAMQQWMGQEKLDAVGLGLGEEFSNSFTQGFNSIITQSLLSGDSSEVMKGKLRDYANGWKQLAGSTSEYSRIIEQASEKQEEYLDHIGEQGAIENYQSNVEGLAQKLEALAKAQDTSTEAGKAFAEQCQQQANALRNYATEGAMSLSEALNVLSGKFTEARGAKERFDQAIQGGDYYTAAEGFRSIVDTVLDEKNVAGDGSLTAWIGAEQVLGQNFVDTHSWDEIVSHLKTVNTLFDEGAEGVYNFNDMLVEAFNEGKIQDMGKVVDGAFEFDFDNVDNIKKWADELGIAEDVLAGMIDKSRQFAAINVGNNKQIRQALEQSGQAMVGQSYGAGGKSALYTSESAFRQEAYRQGVRGDDYVKTKEDLTTEQNVQFLTVDSLTAKSGDGLGIDKVLSDIGLKGTDKTLNNTVAALTQMGFSLDEQKKILTSDGLKLADGKATDKEIEEAYQEQEFATENPTVAGIASDTGVIASAATAILASMGILTEQTKKDIKQSTSDETVNGLLDSLNPKKGFTNSASRDTAREQVQGQIDKYDETISLLQQSSNKDAVQPYIDELLVARNKLQTGLNSEANNWETQLSNASKLIKNIGNETEQTFLQEHAVDIESIFNEKDIMNAAQQLRALGDEGDLTRNTMVELGNALIQQNWDAFSQLNNADLDAFLSKIGLTSEEIRQVKAELNTPFTLDLQASGINLEEYVNSINNLTSEQKTILLNAQISNVEKVSQFIDSINAEFGDGSEKTKTIILEAEAKMAAGDQTGAEELLKEAGFSEQDVKTITQKLSITVDGSIANKGEVQQALNEEISNLKLESNAEIELKAKVNIDKQTAQTGGTINYKSTVDQSGINQAKNAASQGAEMPIKANDQASSTINAIRSKASQSVSFNVSPNFTGTWTKTLTIVTKKSTKEDARGQNYSIPAHQSISFGAAADGLNVPKKNKRTTSSMTALVGEEGYEVGYIPSEQRSVIFGANGPELTSFPKDTIIYPHKQSQDIVRRGKQVHKTIGSFVSGKLPTRGSSSSFSSSSSSSKSSNSSSNSTEKAAEATIDASKLIANAVVWWENILRRTESIQRRADKNQKIYEKYLKQIQSTLKNTGTVGQANDYIANLQKVIDLNQQQVNRATIQLSNFDYGTAQQRQAAKTKGTSDDKKAQAWAFDHDVGGIVKVSYKDGNESKEELVNTANLVKAQDGTYIIDQAQLNKIKNKEKRKAVADALNKELDSYISKRNKAEDEIQKAQEALEKLSEELYETFFAWENELTHIWNLTQKIEQAQSRMGRSDSLSELLEAQFASGKLKVGDISVQRDLTNFRSKLQNQTDLLRNRQQAITENQKELSRLLDSTDKRQAFQQVTNKLNSGVLSATERSGYQKYQQELQSQIAAEDLGRRFSTITRRADGTIDIQFDTDAFERERLNGNITSDMAKAVQEWVKSVQEAASNLQESYENLIKDVTEYYNQLEDLQSKWADYGKQLTEIVENSEKKQIDRLKKLADSIKKALDDLIAEVKRKLDERRRLEDNIKTEQDISRKQQRLAALRADTSGGNKVEIAQLEKEIAEAQQNYQRSLEDQLIKKLEEQNDLAAKQRERQIEIQESIAETTNNIAKVNEWMANPKLYEEDIRKQYYANADYDNVTKAEQLQIEQDFNSFYNGLLTNQQKQAELNTSIQGLTDVLNQLNDLIKYQNLTLEEAKANGINLTDAKNLFTNASWADLKNVGKYNLEDFRGQSISTMKAAGFSAAELKAGGYSFKQLNSGGYSLNELKGPFNEHDFGASGVSYANAKSVGYSVEQLRNVKEYADQANAEIDKRNKYNAYMNRLLEVKRMRPTSVTRNEVNDLITLGLRAGFGRRTVLTDLLSGTGGSDPFSWPQLIKAIVTANGINRYSIVKTWPNPDNSLITALKMLDKPNTLADIKKHSAYKKAQPLAYKQGGLANYTGPAWLDGTPSKPELVLNATDTKNFLALKDILSGAMSSINSTHDSSYGSTMYEININVDHINNDYDVDKIAERVKRNIVKDASYRNVAQVRNFR